MTVSFCELREKEVVNLCDGKRLGYVTDVEAEFPSGRITALILPRGSKYLPVFSSKNCIRIPWQNVEKIGDDFILIRYAVLPPVNGK